MCLLHSMCLSRQINLVFLYPTHVDTSCFQEGSSVGECVVYLQLLFHGIVVSHTILSLNSNEAKYCMAQNSSFNTREFYLDKQVNILFWRECLVQKLRGCHIWCIS